MAPILRATSITSSSSASGGHTFHASPHATASSALIHSAVKMKWAAACQPIRCGSSSEPAASVVTPSVTNGTLSRAPSAIHTMSQ